MQAWNITWKIQYLKLELLKRKHKNTSETLLALKLLKERKLCVGELKPPQGHILKDAMNLKSDCTKLFWQRPENFSYSKVNKYFMNIPWEPKNWSKFYSMKIINGPRKYAKVTFWQKIHEFSIWLLQPLPTMTSNWKYSNAKENIQKESAYFAVFINIYPSELTKIFYNLI